MSVTGLGQRIALSTFIGTKWAGRKSSGVTAQIFKDQPTRTYVGAFMSSGRVLVRAFAGGAGGKRVGRLPLRQLTGPDIGSILIETGNHQIAGPLLGWVQDLMGSEVERLIGVEIGNIAS